MAEGDETQAGSDEPPSPARGPPGGGGELLPGTRIDRYQVEARLGAGAMGVVYAARDLHLGRTVAVKVVGEWLDAGAGQARLVREAQAMARLRHPNLATVFDIGVSGTRLFVVMELIEGGTLADWLGASPRTWQEILAVYLQAARGLAAAHAAGFVHRDFKPENVLVEQGSVARVTDFGVAHLLGDEEGAAPGVAGTPGYIAPEVLRGQPVDGRADQFSLCVALYTSLYGRRPFDRLEGTSRLTETLGQLRPPPAGVAPPWLARILTRGLAADPRDRWPTLEALVLAIEWRQGLRRRTLGALGAVAALAAALGLGLAVLLLPRTAPGPAPDWAPVVIGRERRDLPLAMAVSPDGSTLVSFSPDEAWVEPRAGGGVRRRVAFPAQLRVVQCRLSRTGDQLSCSFERGAGAFEIWTLDVASGRQQRRVPAEAAPALKPGKLFDLGPDGSILFGTADLTEVWRLDGTGAPGRVLTAGPGELITGWTWSLDGARIAFKVRIPGGARIEVLDLRSGARTIVSHRICQELEWLTGRSLACAPRAFRNPVVIELLLPDGTGEATERIRYVGPEYQQLTGLSASSAGVLLSTSPNDQHLGLLGLEAPGEVRRISSGGVTDLPAIGWTPSGSLIFGANVQGHLRIMALRPDGGVETVRAGPASEVPLVVLGEDVLFGRFPGGESSIPFFETPYGRRYPDGELFRLAASGAEPRSLGRTRGFSALLCASGGAEPPCLLAERSEGEVEATGFDPGTGARGPVRARWLLHVHTSTGALAPGGRTLAQVRRVLGRGELSFLDLERGTRRPVPAAGMSLDFPRWQPDGTLLAVAARAGERWIVRVRDQGEVERLAQVPGRDEATTATQEFEVSPDGKTAAILLTDALRTHWWVSRPPD